jgi:hypothetical protein
MSRREYYRQSRLGLTRACLDCGAPATIGYCRASHGKETPRLMADSPVSACRECGRPLHATSRTLCFGCLTGETAP